MHRTLYILSVLLTFGYHSYSQVKPAERAILNYRLIGFSYPATQNGNRYLLEVAEGRYDDEQAFRKNISIKIYSTANKITALVPHFGKEYTWTISCEKGSRTVKGEIHHFATGNAPVTDTSIQRLRILSCSPGITDKYFFADGPGVMYDVNGMPVWYMPADTSNEIRGCTDLKITEEGTFTVLSNNKAFEIDYDGNILWSSPVIITEDSILFVFHHELTKLRNGHYMTLMSSRNLSPVANAAGRKKYFPDLQDGRLVELDKAGKIVWEWATSDYFMGSDLPALSKKNDSSHIDFHENAFSFNEQDSTIYLSFNGLSRVVKIKYPSGALVSTYGNLYKPEPQAAIAVISVDKVINIQSELASNYLFCKQHSCKMAKDGSLYVYNNNMQNLIPNPAANQQRKVRTPQVLKLKESASDHNVLTPVWTFDCIPPEEQQIVSGGGGNVVELADESLFISTNVPHSKLFLLNSAQKELWTGILEKKTAANVWENAPCYRCSIISSKEEMERMIWHK